VSRSRVSIEIKSRQIETPRLTYNLPNEFVKVDDDESGDHDLEDVSREIVMEEEGPVVEEERQKVEEISAKENLSDLNKFLPQIWKKIKII
jgi:hypothetical protein